MNILHLLHFAGQNMSLSPSYGDSSTEAKVDLTSTLFILIGPNDREPNQVEVCTLSYFMLFV